MQTLSGTLTASQAKQDVSPYVALTIGDVPPETPRLSGLVSQYSGAEPDSPFDASWTDTGLFVRARLTGGTCYVQIFDPAAPTYSSWTTIDATAGNWSGTQQVAILGTRDGSGDAWVFYVKADGHTINYSKYHAGAWGAVALVKDAGGGNLVAGLACCGNDPTIRLFYVVSGASVWEIHWTGAAWSVAVGDGGTYPIVQIAASFRPTTAPSGDGDTWVVIVYNSPSLIVIQQFKITSGAGWAGSLVTLLQAGASLSYSYAFPHFTESRSDSPRCCLTWSEVAPSPIGTAPVICFTPEHRRLTGVLPWRYGGSSAFGVKLFLDVRTPTNWFVVTSNQVYLANGDSTSQIGRRLAIAQSDVVELDVRLPGPNRPGVGRVTVLNTNGVYKDAGVVGSAHQCLRAWSQVAISVGYNSPGVGPEHVFLPAFWIEAISFHDEVLTGRPLMTLHLVDSWGILERLRYRSTITYLAQTPEWLLDGILWHVCGVLGGTGNARLTAFTLSTFTVRAGETLAVVARRLLDLGAVTLVFRPLSGPADGIGPTSTGAIGISRASSGSVYNYGAAGQHPILQSEVAPLVAPAATAVEVSGLTSTSLVRNWAQAWLLWRDIQVRLVDKSLIVQASTDAVSANRATVYVPEGQGGSILVLANVGQELEDQITLTIASAPVAAVVYTVVGIHWAYRQAGGAAGSVDSGRILQTLLLEGSN